MPNVVLGCIRRIRAAVRRGTITWAVLLMGLVVSTSLANPGARVELDTPVRVTFKTSDGSAIKGVISAFDDSSFDLLDEPSEARPFAWSDLEPKVVFSLHDRLLSGPRNTAGAWLQLGTMLQPREHGAPLAERAFAKAVLLDPSLREQVQELKRSGNSSTDGNAKPGTDPPDGAAAESAPQVVGKVQSQNWGPLTPEQSAQAVAQLERFASETRAKINPALQRFETQYFLFYCDLAPKEAHKWAGLLDKMYARLCALFGVEKGTNIWSGKALVFVFSKPDDYASFQQIMHHTDPGASAGMCHNFGSGEVHIAFYRQPNEADFANILVHESVHGFLHRYRSPENIPSWINEGLADTIAGELVPTSRWVNIKQQQARSRLLKSPSLGGDFFSAQHIDAWQYGVASSLCAFMIQQNKKGYVAFINGIKDGSSWEESLEKNYGVSLDRLLDAYGRSLGVKELQP